MHVAGDNKSVPGLLRDDEAGWEIIRFRISLFGILPSGALTWLYFSEGRVHAVTTVLSCYGRADA